MREFQKSVFRTKTDEGVEAELCYDLSNPNIACVNCGTIVFDPFDHMVVRFGYNKPSNGSDLDIKVFYNNTGTVQDGNSVGYGYSVTTPINSDGSSGSTSYLWWATDDVSSPAGPCVEAVVIGIKNFTTNVSSVGNIIEIPLRVGWYGALGDGNIAVELVTYSGGTMYKDGTNILNSGGTVVDTQSTSKNIVSCCGFVTDVHSQLVGTVQYNKTTKAAILVP